LQPLNTVGYIELFEFKDGLYTLTEAIDLIKMHTRQYAKRQITWFNKEVKNQ
jgi:tRNA dimethylallyltransferase